MEGIDRMNNNVELIKSFSNLPISDKRKELGREISELTVVIYKLLADITNVNGIPDMDEFNNLYDSKISEDEYLTGLYEDLINYKELLGIYLSKALGDVYNQ